MAKTIQLKQEDLDFFRSKKIIFTHHGEDRFKVGDRISFADDCAIEPFSCVMGGNHLYTMGSFSYTISQFPHSTTIGRYCSISWGCKVMGINHPMTAVSTSSFTYDKTFRIFLDALEAAEVSDFPKMSLAGGRDGLIIGNDVWIGQDVIFKRGLTIGTGAIVAASSVVTKSVPPYAVVAGNPAKIIKMRFPEPLIERLLASQWWDYAFTDFAKMDYEKPEIFLDNLERRKENNDITPFIPEAVELIKIFS